MNSKFISVLLAEDSDDDAELVLNELRRQKFEVRSTRVMTAATFRDALNSEVFDVILSDYVMPGFLATDALELLHESKQDIPLIVISGTIGEDVAVEAMRLGAADYLLKQNLTRLGATVDREIREAKVRRLKMLLDLFVQSQNEVLEMILNAVPLGSILERIVERLESLPSEKFRCSIMLHGTGEPEVVYGNAPALPPKYRELFVKTNHSRVIVLDEIGDHPSWESSHEAVRRLGVRGCWAIPILSAEQNMLGVLAVYHDESRLPGSEEERWLDSASKLVSLAVERSLNAAKLRKSETLLRIASQAAQLGGWTVDFPAVRVIWSDEVCAIHGVPAGTSPNFDDATGFILPEYRARISEVFEECLYHGASFDEEFEIKSADGNRVWVRSIGVGIRDLQGEVVRVQGAIQDITARRTAQEREARSVARMTSTLENLTDPFLIIDQDWRVIYINKQAALMVSEDRSTLVGSILWDTFPGLSGTDFEREYRRALDENCAVEFTQFYVPQQCWLETRVFPTEEGLAVTLHDVTERLGSQEQLILLENCISRINDIVIVTEADLLDEPGPRIVLVNDAFVRRTGYSREEVIGKSPRFLQGPETQRESLDRIRKALTERSPVRTEVINYTKSGEKMWLEIDIVPVSDRTGVLKHMIAVERDITERKQAEEGVLANELRYLRQRNALIDLTSGVPFDSVELSVAFGRITEASARTLNVSRVSIWRFSKDRSKIECMCLYELEKGVHTFGAKLYAVDYPNYFKSLSELELIVSDDASADPQLVEFSGGYLDRFGIDSMIDAPIRFGNSVEYVMCHEQVGGIRKWSADEKTFVIAVANLVSLALEANERARAECEAKKSHQRFQSVAAATNDSIWDWDLINGSFWWSDGFAHLFGWTSMDKELTVHAWIRQIHPDDRDRVVNAIFAAVEGGKSHWVDEYRFLSNDGSVAHVLDRAEILRDEEGRGIRMVGGMMDLTERKAAQIELARSHRALQMLSSCNESLVRVTDEQLLLNEACQVAVGIGGYKTAWVGYAMEDAGQRIVPMAQAGEDASGLSQDEISWSDEKVSGQGPIGRAVREGQTVVVPDIEAVQLATPCLNFARRKGSRRVICLPLSNERRTFGVMLLFADELQPTGEDELKLLNQMVMDLAFGIQNLRVRTERQRTQEVVVKVAQAVSSGVGVEFFDLLARNMVEALGADGGGIFQYDRGDDSLRSSSFYLDGMQLDNVCHRLEGTVCGSVANGAVGIYQKDVRQLFPSDPLLSDCGFEAFAGIPLFDSKEVVCGIMAVFFYQPLKERAMVESTLRIFAARAAAEMERQQSDARIREQASLLDKAQDAIMVRDLHHVITFWNKGAERIYGWTAEEAIGRPVTELLYLDTTNFDKAFEHTICTGEWVGELMHVNREGNDLIIESRWTLVKGPDGTPQSLLVINTDISEHRNLESQFQRAQRLESIGTLAGGIAHDLNNILAPISMAIELLKMRMPEAWGIELLDTIAASAKRGTDMVGQVLSFARGMEGRRIEIHPQQAIREVESFMRDTFLKNILIDVNAHRDLWSIQGDPTQLHQVLLNLCLNARDAVGEDGKISITAENVEIDESFAAINLEAKTGPHVRIQIEDNGEGITPENLEKIFDPFFTTKSIGKGTGLGLSTTRSIIKSHGGFIRVFSRIGKGTRFRVYLPAQPEILDPIVRARIELPHGNGETVLVVDDEEFIRQITKETLETFGYRTLLALDGNEALAIYSENQPLVRVVLTDMMMPGMDGGELIHCLMKLDPQISIIATSGIDSNKDLAYAAGVKAFLPKPCTAEVLLKCLREILAVNY